jgi:hypothetical protein
MRQFSFTIDPYDLRPAVRPVLFPAWIMPAAVTLAFLTFALVWAA